MPAALGTDCSRARATSFPREIQRRTGRRDNGLSMSVKGISFTLGPPDFQLQPLRKRVDAAHTHTVQAAENLRFHPRAAGFPAPATPKAR